MSTNAFKLPIITLAFALPIFCFTNRANCQTQDETFDFLDDALYRKFTLFVGGSIPLGEFASKDPSVSNSGFAQLGVGGGAEYVAELTKRVGLALTGMIEGYGQDVSGWKEAFPWYTFHGDTRFLYWALGGLFLDQELSKTSRLYCVTEVGLLYANYPDLNVKDAYDNILTLTAPSVPTIGYGIALGGVYRSYDFSVRYQYGNPEFHPVGQLGRDKAEYAPEFKPVRVIQIKFGYCLN